MSPCCHLMGPGSAVLKVNPPQTSPTTESKSDSTAGSFCETLGSNELNRSQNAEFARHTSRWRQSGTDVAMLNLLCSKREGRGNNQPEPIAADSSRDWPPFTGCWLACYIKETPPTAAPDNLVYPHGWGKGQRRTCLSFPLHHFYRKDPCWEAPWNLLQLLNTTRYYTSLLFTLVLPWRICFLSGHSYLPVILTWDLSLPSSVFAHVLLGFCVGLVLKTIFTHFLYLFDSIIFTL